MAEGFQGDEFARVSNCDGGRREGALRDCFAENRESTREDLVLTIVSGDDGGEAGQVGYSFDNS
jgi:hypothetical protein